MLNQIYIGIDPGKTGAIAIIYPGKIKIIDFENFVKTNIFDTNYHPLRSVINAVIEKVSSSPQQGVCSAFSFGQNYGFWQGILYALDISYELISPQKWQKEIFDSKKEDDRKEMSRQMARRLFPQLNEHLKRKKDHNRADALLIAEYCRRKYQIKDS